MTPMPKDKNQQEDWVIDSLLEHLKGAGVSAKLLERPDRCAEVQRTYPKVTTDALIRIPTGGAQVDWAIDVMSLAAPSDHVAVPDGLHERLSPLAERHKVVIEISGGTIVTSDQLKCVERAANKATSDQLKGVKKDVGRATSDQLEDVERAANKRTLDQLKGVKKAVNEALKNSKAPTGTVTAGGLDFSWRPVGPEETPRLQVRELPLGASSPNLSEQVKESLCCPLTAKATKQAARARDAGCKTAVVIDRRGHENIRQGSHWLPRYPITIREAVTAILADGEHALDAVLLHDLEDEWYLLFGAFPGVEWAD